MWPRSRSGHRPSPPCPVHFGGGCMRPQRRRVREKYSASSGANQRSFLQGESLTPRSLSFIPPPPPLPPFPFLPLPIVPPSRAAHAFVWLFTCSVACRLPLSGPSRRQPPAVSRLRIPRPPRPSSATLRKAVAYRHVSPHGRLLCPYSCAPGT